MQIESLITAKRLILLAALGSAGVLLAGFGFQHIGGLEPCTMCLLQRWPHAVGAVTGVLALLTPWAALIGVGASITGTGLAIYHSGIERHWWPGPASCSGGADISQMTPEELLAQIQAAPVVRCDEIPWELFGLSMANYNVFISIGLAATWALALRLALSES